MSEEAPESDYEYINPVHVVLIDDDKDDVATSASSSPPSSWITDNSDDYSNSHTPQSCTNAFYVPPRRAAGAVSGRSRHHSKPVLLSVPTMNQTTAAATVSEKRLGPPVPPRMHRSASDVHCPRCQLDRAGGCVEPRHSDDDDNRSEPTAPQDVQDNRHHHWRPTDGHYRRRRRANSVDSLLNWPTSAVSSLSDSDSDSATRRPRTDVPPNPQRSSMKFRGDVGLVPANIASLSVEEVSVYEC